MHDTQPFQISLTPEVAMLVSKQLSTGAYLSVDEVMQAGIRALEERNADLDRWLNEEVVSGYHAFMRDPSCGIPADQVVARIKARQQDEGAQ